MSSYVTCDPWVAVVVTGEGVGVHYRHWLPGGSVKRREVVHRAAAYPQALRRTAPVLSEDAGP